MRIVLFLLSATLLLNGVTACHKSSDTPATPVTPPDTLLAWQKTTGLSDAEDIWFVNPAKGFVAGNKTIYSSSDSGKTWTAIPGVSGGVYNLNFWDTQIGAAIGLTDLYVTVNGGTQWSRKPMPSLVGITLVDIQFTAPSTAYIATPGGLYKTTDTCNTWAKVFDAQIGGLYFFNSSEGLFCQLSGTNVTKNISGTTDGGAHWQGMSYINDISLNSFMQFSDHTHGWLINGNIFYSTTDGGSTWSPARYAGSSINDVYFLNNLTGYLAAAGEILKTTDGGQTWTRSCKLGHTGIWEVFFLDEKTGWACCNDGSILRLKQ